MKQYIKTNVIRYEHLSHLRVLIETIEKDLEKGIAIDENGQIKKELEKIKREFSRLRKEACEEFDLIDSDEITLRKYGSEMILISSEEKITFDDWFFRVMPRRSLAFYYRQYSLYVELFCEGSEITFPLDEGRKFPFWEGPFFIVYEGNDTENIVIKLVPLQDYTEKEEVLVSEGVIPAPELLKMEILIAGDNDWQKIEVPKEGKKFRSGDKFRWRNSIYQFKAEK